VGQRKPFLRGGVLSRLLWFGCGGQTSAFREHMGALVARRVSLRTGLRAPITTAQPACSAPCLFACSNYALASETSPGSWRWRAGAVAAWQAPVRSRSSRPGGAPAPPAAAPCGLLPDPWHRAAAAQARLAALVRALPWGRDGGCRWDVHSAACDRDRPRRSARLGAVLHPPTACGSVRWVPPPA
jgi:hypothetical protein